MGEIGLRPRFVPAARYALAAPGQRPNGTTKQASPAAMSLRLQQQQANTGLRLASKKMGGRGPMRGLPNYGDKF